MTAEEIGAAISTTSGCRVILAAGDSVMAWREGLAYVFTLSEHQVRIVVRVGTTDGIYEAPPEGRKLSPAGCRRMTELMDGGYFLVGTEWFVPSVASDRGSVRLNHVLFADGLSQETLLREFERLGETAKGWYVLQRNGGDEKDRPEDEVPFGSEMFVRV